MKIRTSIAVAMCVVGMAVMALAIDRVPATMVRTFTDNYSWLTGSTAQADFDYIDDWVPWANAYLAFLSNLAQSAYNNSLTNATDLSGNIWCGGLVQTNIDTKVSYMGYPRVNNKAVVRSAGAGTHPATYTTLITDTNLTTFIRGTNNAGTEVSYFMDLEEEHDGVIVVVGTSEDSGSDVKYSVLASKGYPGVSGGYWRGTATPTTAGAEVWTNGIHKMVVPFNGRYVGTMIRNTAATAKVYKLYEIIVYGHTNAWRNW